MALEHERIHRTDDSWVPFLGSGVKPFSHPSTPFSTLLC
jgi:hypothetical protein